MWGKEMIKTCRQEKGKRTMHWEWQIRRENIPII